MVANLRTSMHEIINEAEWMDEATKAEASTKLDKITPVIAYPDYILDPNDPKMDDDYKNAPINSTTYFENIQGLTALGEAESFGLLRSKVDPNE